MPTSAVTGACVYQGCHGDGISIPIPNPPHTHTHGDPHTVPTADLVFAGAAEMSRYDYDYEQTTDGRYERRPYGPHLPRRGRRGAAVPATLPTTALAVVAALAPPLLTRDHRRL